MSRLYLYLSNDYRYAKKVGDQWGVTRDGGDFPIYATTFVGLAITVWFALVYVPSL